MKDVATKLLKDEEVTFRPRGGSMHPIVKNGQEVTVRPFVPGEELKVGTVVLCQVGRKLYFHKIVEKKRMKGPICDTPEGIREVPLWRYKIGNNKGRVNGWANFIYGVKK